MRDRPSSRSDPERPVRTHRRQLLAGAATAAVAGTAGCSALGRASLSTEVIEDSDRRIAWGYPRTDGDTSGIGYAALSYDRRVAPGTSALRFTLNTTVADLSTVESYNGYEADWFRARVGTPGRYQQEHGDASIYVRPPGGWKEFGARYENGAAGRELVVEFRQIDTEGTIEIPLIVDPGGDPVPPSLRCSFEVQASKPGVLGRTVRASDAGRLAFDLDA